MKLLKFYADWCGPCKSLSAVIENAGDKITMPIQEVNIDTTPELAILYSVRSVPTLIVLDDNGAVKARVVGNMNESALLTFLKG
jgi:thioredoxin 1